MKVKFVLLGGQNGGKTAILRRYFHGDFSEGMSTIGVDVYSTITTIKSPLSSSKEEYCDEKANEECKTNIASYEDEAEKREKRQNRWNRSSD